MLDIKNFEREAENFYASSNKKEWKQEISRKKEPQQMDSFNRLQTKEKRVQERRNKYI